MERSVVFFLFVFLLLFKKKLYLKTIKDLKGSLLSSKVGFRAKNNIILYSAERQLKEVSVFVHVCVCVYSLHTARQRDL